MATRMVQLQNMVNKTVGVRLPEYGFHRKWTKKGQMIPVPYDTIEQMLWHEGFRRMIDRGILYIPNMKDKIDLGLEPEGASEPENIIVLSDLQIKNLMTSTPVEVFKKEISGLPIDQIKNVVNYCISNKIVDAEKCRILKEITHTDILKAVSQNQDLEKE